MKNETLDLQPVQSDPADVLAEQKAEARLFEPTRADYHDL
jgi:hypothetical protein